MGRRQWSHHDDIEKSHSNVNDVGCDTYIKVYTKAFLRNVVGLYLSKRFRYDNDVAETFVQYLPYYTCALQETNSALSVSSTVRRLDVGYTCANDSGFSKIRESTSCNVILMTEIKHESARIF